MIKYDEDWEAIWALVHDTCSKGNSQDWEGTLNDAIHLRTAFSTKFEEQRGIKVTYAQNEIKFAFYDHDTMSDIYEGITYKGNRIVCYKGQDRDEPKVYTTVEKLNPDKIKIFDTNTDELIKEWSKY